MTNLAKGLLGGAAVAVVAGFGGYLLARQGGGTPPVATRPAVGQAPAKPAASATHAAAPQAAGATPPTATPPTGTPAAATTAVTTLRIGPCVAPDTAPPQTPNGATATDAQMKAAHDALQAYVDKLEALQACLNHAAQTSGSDVPPQLRDTWINRGNGAIDEANLLAEAFANAKDAFDAAHPKK